MHKLELAELLDKLNDGLITKIKEDLASGLSDIEVAKKHGVFVRATGPREDEQPLKIIHNNYNCTPSVKGSTLSVTTTDGETASVGLVGIFLLKPHWSNDAHKDLAEIYPSRAEVEKCVSRILVYPGRVRVRVDKNEVELDVPGRYQAMVDYELKLKNAQDLKKTPPTAQDILDFRVFG